VTQGYQLVETPPAFTPLRYGLLSAAQVVDDPDEHWQLGAVMVPDPCAAASVVTGGPCSSSGITKSPTVSGLPASAAQPFTVYAWIDCSPIGHGDNLADLRARTTRQLTNGEGRAVERTFWTGVAQNGTVMPHLAEDTQVLTDAFGAETVELQSAATVVSGTPTSLTEGIALLEGSLAQCYGGEGVIHVPAAAVIHLSNVGIVRQQGPQLRTLLGNLVAAYSSGDREGPTGVDPAAGQAWIYGTGAVQARRSPIKDQGMVTGAIIGKADNSTVYLVERTYLLDWDCCHFATLVNIPGLAT
jgi:hypothetical protein